MPASLAPITPELLKDLQDGKESALEQLFRPNFDELSKEAAERLDGHLAQKVVGKVLPSRRLRPSSRPCCAKSSVRASRSKCVVTLRCARFPASTPRRTAASSTPT